MPYKLLLLVTCIIHIYLNGVNGIALIDPRPDTAFSSSGVFNNNPVCNATKAKFSSDNAWCPNVVQNSWIKVDLGYKYVIESISTKGSKIDQEWVITYELQYSLDNVTYTLYPGNFTGNSDQDTANNHTLMPTIIARFISFHPTIWEEWPSMRIEAYGYLYTEPPTNDPTPAPTTNPTASPTTNPTPAPTNNPTSNPTPSPTQNPTYNPTLNPTKKPTVSPTMPSVLPTILPSKLPTNDPSRSPTVSPIMMPSVSPSLSPQKPSLIPTIPPSLPSVSPSLSPSNTPSLPSNTPSNTPSISPSNTPSNTMTTTPVETGTMSANKLTSQYLLMVIIGIAFVFICCGIALCFCYTKQKPKRKDTTEVIIKSHSSIGSNSSLVPFDGRDNNRNTTSEMVKIKSMSHESHKIAEKHDENDKNPENDIKNGKMEKYMDSDDDDMEAMYNDKVHVDIDGKTVDAFDDNTGGVEVSCDDDEVEDMYDKQKNTDINIGTSNNGNNIMMATISSSDDKSNSDDLYDEHKNIDNHRGTSNDITTSNNNNNIGNNKSINNAHNADNMMMAEISRLDDNSNSDDMYDEHKNIDNDIGTSNNNNNNNIGHHNNNINNAHIADRMVMEAILKQISSSDDNSSSNSDSDIDIGQKQILLDIKSGNNGNQNNNDIIIGNEGNNQYFWIQNALKQCVENGWNKYLNKFKKHKITDDRLLHIPFNENIWESIFPEIGIRFQFIALCKARFNDANLANVYF